MGKKRYLNFAVEWARIYIYINFVVIVVVIVDDDDDDDDDDDYDSH
jgi:hypothetical protein